MPKSNYILVTNARAKFVYVFAPNNHDKYSIQVLLDKNDPQVAKLQRKVKEIMTAAFPNAAKEPKSPIHDGDVDRDTTAYPEYTNTVFLEPSSKFQPQVIDRNGAPLAPASGLLKNGAIVNVAINFYDYNASGNKGVGVGLGKVQYWEAGEPMTQGVNSVVFPTISSTANDTASEATAQEAQNEEASFNELLDECEDL